MQKVLFAFFRIEVPRRLQRQPWAHRSCAHAQQNCDMVNLAAIACLRRDAHLRPHPCADQCHVHRPCRHGHRNRNRLWRRVAIGKDQQRRACRDTSSTARRAKMSTATSSVRVRR